VPYLGTLTAPLCTAPLGVALLCGTTAHRRRTVHVYQIATRDRGTVSSGIGHQVFGRALLVVVGLEGAAAVSELELELQDVREVPRFSRSYRRLAVVREAGGRTRGPAQVHQGRSLQLEAYKRDRGGYVLQ